MSDLSDSDSSLREDEVVFTEQEVLRTGLSILHYIKKKIRRAKRATNLDRFKGHYGVLPVVVCELVQDLQTELTGKLYIPRKKMVLQYLLMALHQASGTAGAGVALPDRPAPLQTMIASWVNALPGPDEMMLHPFLWPEQDQEILQSSSTNKIYRRLDDLEEDCAWLTTNVFNKDRVRFPESVTWNNSNGEGGSTIP
jgi:hypothetical protein